MLIVQVDVIGTEPLKRTIDGFLDMRRTAVESDLFVVWSELPGEFGRDDDIVSSLSFQGAPNQFFIFERPIRFRRIEEIHPDIESMMNHTNTFRFIGAAVRPRHSHAAQTQG